LRFVSCLVRRISCFAFHVPFSTGEMSV
jgi:hypothetical protein